MVGRSLLGPSKIHHLDPSSQRTELPESSASILWVEIPFRYTEQYSNWILTSKNVVVFLCCQASFCIVVIDHRITSRIMFASFESWWCQIHDSNVSLSKGWRSSQVQLEWRPKKRREVVVFAYRTPIIAATSSFDSCPPFAAWNQLR